MNDLALMPMPQAQFNSIFNVLIWKPGMLPMAQKDIAYFYFTRVFPGTTMN